MQREGLVVAVARLRRCSHRAREERLTFVPMAVLKQDLADVRVGVEPDIEVSRRDLPNAFRERQRIVESAIGEHDARAEKRLPAAQRIERIGGRQRCVQKGADFGEIALGDQDVAAEQPEAPRPHRIGLRSGVRDGPLGERLRVRQFATQEREVRCLKGPLEIGVRWAAVTGRGDEQHEDKRGRASVIPTNPPAPVVLHVDGAHVATRVRSEHAAQHRQTPLRLRNEQLAEEERPKSGIVTML